MRIAQVAPPFERVPPQLYGGTERVIATLTEELVCRGHEVTLLASGDSHVSARHVPIVEQAIWRQSALYRDFGPFWMITLGKLMTHLDEFDLIHSHLDYYGLPLTRAARCPVVSTLHGRLDAPELVPLYQEFADAPVISISDAQRRPIPHANWQATVYNGIDIHNFTPRMQPSDYLAFLGRISPDKGLDIAIRVALRAGVPIKIAARQPLPYIEDPNVRQDWEYYNHVVKPLLCQPGVEMVGEVSGKEKDELLGNAAALLFPIRWPEPFGLVMAEALACGTPVLALREGSVPEVLQEGVTGFIRDNEDELVATVDDIGKLSRQTCRLEAERRYSPAAMTDGYLSVYERLMGEPSIEGQSLGLPLSSDQPRDDTLLWNGSTM